MMLGKVATLTAICLLSAGCDRNPMIGKWKFIPEPGAREVARDCGPSKEILEITETSIILPDRRPVPIVHSKNGDKMWVQIGPKPSGLDLAFTRVDGDTVRLWPGEFSGASAAVREVGCLMRRV